MTSPQDPWQQQGGYQQYPQGGQPQYGTPSGGFPQQNAPGYQQQYQAGYQQYPQGGYPQQGGYQQNPYGAPPVRPQESAGVPRPATINIAFWISIVVPIVVTVMMAVTFLVMQGWMNDTIDQSVAESGADAGSAEAQQAASLGSGILMAMFIAVIIFYAVLTGLWILFGFQLRAGKNWARITLTVFAALWLLSGISGLISGTAGLTMTSTEMPSGVGDLPGSYQALSYAQSGLAVVGMIAFIVLVYLKPSNWFIQASAQRR